MTRVGLLSDTHGTLLPELLEVFADCEEIWHAGDVGDTRILDSLQEIKPVRAVWGNIDDTEMRQRLPEDLVFQAGGARVLLSHIVGHPGRLHRRAKALLLKYDPDLVIYGHSHILRLDYQQKSQTLFVNPGAVGNQGMHQIRTVMKFRLQDRLIDEFQILELGNRGTKSESVTKIVSMDPWPLRPKT